MRTCTEDLTMSIAYLIVQQARHSRGRVCGILSPVVCRHSCSSGTCTDEEQAAPDCRLYPRHDHAWVDQDMAGQVLEMQA